MRVLKNTETTYGLIELTEFEKDIIMECLEFANPEKIMVSLETEEDVENILDNMFRQLARE